MGRVFDKIYKITARSLIMKHIMKITILAMLVTLIFVPLRSASASSGLFDGKIIFGQSFTLESGETLIGDLVVIGGSVTIEQGATVEGNVAIIGGNLTMDGEVSGDVAVIGGEVSLGEASHVTGSLAMVGGSLSRTAGARVDGNIVNNVVNWTGDIPNIPNVPNPPVVPTVPKVIYVNPFHGISNAFGQSVALGIVAMLLMLFLASQVDRVARTVMSQPLIAGGVGLLTMILAPVAIVLMILTIMLIPVTPVLVFLLVAAGVFGWIAIGYEVGKRITKAFKWTWHPSFSAGLGTFLLTITANALGGIPVLNCVGWLVPFLLTAAALGSVIMTIFGTRSIVKPTDTTLMSSPPPPAEPSVQ
jgi:hypothetical protein